MYPSGGRRAEKALRIAGRSSRFPAMSDTPLPQDAFAPRQIRSPDGLSLAVRQHGNAQGRPVIFIHGYSQAGLCWARQVEDPTLSHLRLVTYDLRGHGGSDKPLDPAHYQEGHRWAGDVRAIMDGLGLDRPILVGWSYGGRIIGDYLRAYGSADLGGLVFVDAITGNERGFYGSCNRLMKQMTDLEPATAIAATRAFLRRCVHVPLDTDTFEILLAANMMVPPQVRAAMGRPAEYDDLLARLDRPTLVVHGREDQVIALAMAEHIAALVPGAQQVILDETGHAPFLERPDAFNTRLAAFVAQT